ncbi:Mnd1 [Symbiodinium sp. KB8]|nr:Mnd1 [Symbiodinium sp. KB8]
MSLEEKRQVMLDMLQESKEPFLLKELEKLGGKKVVQSIKEVLQSLVDDGLVDLEKIGIQNFYWSFPTKALVKLTAKKEEAQEKLDSELSRVEELKGEVAALAAERTEGDERSDKLAQLGDLRAKKRRLEGQVQEQRANDPETLMALGEDVAKAKDAANRWVDNIFTLKSYCVEKFSMVSSEFDKALGLPADLDYMT